MKRFEIKKEVDTRDQTDLWVIRFSEKLDNFNQVRETLKKHKVYYSRFKGGFISKAFIDDETVMNMLDNLADATVKSDNKKTGKIIYHKTLNDYITIDEIRTSLEKIVKDKEFYINDWAYGYYEHPEDKVQKFIDENVERFTRYLKNNFELGYIREAIVMKSLKKSPFDFNANGSKLTYLLIWDKLPIIEDLKITDEAYTATWGYDQTNVDIAYRLNKKFNGLDILYSPTETDRILLKRIKENGYFAFKHRVGHYKRDSSPLKTFENDASQTGRYR